MKKVKGVWGFASMMEGFDTAERARGRMGYGLVMSWRRMQNGESIRVHHYVNVFSSI